MEHPDRNGGFILSGLCTHGPVYTEKRKASITHERRYKVVLCVTSSSFGPATSDGIVEWNRLQVGNIIAYRTFGEMSTHKPAVY